MSDNLFALVVVFWQAAAGMVNDHFNKLPSRDPLRPQIEEGFARFGISLTANRIQCELKISHQKGPCWIGFASWSEMTARLKNLAAVVEKAAAYFEGKTISEKRFTRGWIMCFLTDALHADSDRKRELYARALAKEAENPRQTSLTLIAPN